MTDFYAYRSRDGKHEFLAFASAEDRATYVNRDLGQTQPLDTAGLFIEEADDLDIDVRGLAARGKDSTEHGVNLRRVTTLE